MVYKYYSINKMSETEMPRSIEQLFKGVISFTNIETLNDPCEAISRFSYPINSQMKECERRAYEMMNEHTSDVIRNMNKTLAVFCASETPLNPLMWSHYAEAYRGFCVGYAVEDISSERNGVVSFQKVKYEKNPPDFGELPKEKELLQKKLAEILFHKSCCWKYEHEWRAVCRGEIIRKAKPDDGYDKSTETMFCLGDVCQIYERYIAKTCLAKEVYIGYNMPDEYRILLLNFCQENEIRCYAVEPVCNSYQIKKEVIDFPIEIDWELARKVNVK